MRESAIFATRKFVSLVIASALVMAAPASVYALPSASLSLAQPRLFQDRAEIDVLTSFTPENQADQGAVFVSLLFVDDNDVIDDDPAAFDFTPDALVQDWNLFKDLANPGNFILDTFDPNLAFSGESLTLGTLVIEFDLTIAQPGEVVSVSLDGQDTSVGFEAPPGDFASFDFADLTLGEPVVFTVPDRPGGDAIPEPMTGSLALLAAAALLLPRRRTA